MNKNLFPNENDMINAWEYIESKIFNTKTNMLYDHVIVDENDWPTPEECERSWPNPCGWATNLDDGMINGGTMVEACINRYNITGEKEVAEFAHKLIDGMIRCAETAKSEGFLPRSVTPVDGKSHYIDSSRDQYTMFLYGAHCYINSVICSPEEKEALKEIVLKIAKRAEKNAVPETGYDMLREDGGRSIATIIWGPELKNHEIGRLPMIYLSAWEFTGDEYWLNRYKEIRDEAYERSLPMTSYWHLYTLQQMQNSIRLCYDVDTDREWKKKYLHLMKVVANYVNDKIDYVYSKLKVKEDFNHPYTCFRDIEPFVQKSPNELIYLNPDPGDTDTFFLMQDAANVIIISLTVPGYKLTEEALELFKFAFEKIDLDIHMRAVPIHFLNAYYMLKTGD